jgi:hypothetical protein
MDIQVLAVRQSFAILEVTDCRLVFDWNASLNWRMGVRTHRSGSLLSQWSTFKGAELLT